MAHINELMFALKSEISRISEERSGQDHQEELSEILLEAVNKTLREIKMGADSDDFQELTIINFIILADSAGFPSDILLSFVNELKKSDEDLELTFPEEEFIVRTERLT